MDPVVENWEAERGRRRDMSCSYGCYRRSGCDSRHHRRAELAGSVVDGSLEEAGSDSPEAI